MIGLKAYRVAVRQSDFVLSPPEATGRGLLFFVVIGVVDAFHKHLAVVDFVGQRHF